MKKDFERALSSLEEVFLWLDSLAAEKKLDPASLYTIQLVVEEIFTNVIKYSTHGREMITIDISLSEEVLVLQLIDQDGEPFDPARSPAYDTQQSLEDRPIGKVGLHLVKNLVDEINCDYKNGQNIITVKKKLKE
jgi:serine/threonine-protein kinase RsbW